MEVRESWKVARNWKNTSESHRKWNEKEKKNMCGAFLLCWGKVCHSMQILWFYFHTIRICTRTRKRIQRLMKLQCTEHLSFACSYIFVTRKLSSSYGDDENCELTSSIRSESTGRNGQNNKTHTKGKSLRNEILFSQKIQGLFFSVLFSCGKVFVKISGTFLQID